MLAVIASSASSYGLLVITHEQAAKTLAQIAATYFMTSWGCPSSLLNSACSCALLDSFEEDIPADTATTLPLRSGDRGDIAGEPRRLGDIILAGGGLASAPAPSINPNTRAHRAILGNMISEAPSSIKKRRRHGPQAWTR